MLNYKVLVHYESYQEVSLQVSRQHKPSSVPIRGKFKGRLSYLQASSKFLQKKKGRGGEIRSDSFILVSGKLAELERMHKVSGCGI